MVLQLYLNLLQMELQNQKIANFLAL